MASATAPSTPEHQLAPSSHPQPGLARSATLPSKLLQARRASSPASSISADCETLFVHPAAKVVKFDAKSTPRPSSAVGKGNAGQDVGTLPWSTPTEMTVAAGPLCIYRVPSSGVTVSFLKSGNLLHPILMRAPCWCVDGNSKFVLRTPALFYYRIELPNTDEEESALVEEFKGVLAQITKYEKAACPFRRGFHVEVQNEPETPTPDKVNKWRSSEKAKKWTLGSSVWEREDRRQLTVDVHSPELRPKRSFHEDEDSTYGPSEDGSSTPPQEASPQEMKSPGLPSPDLKAPKTSPSVLDRVRSIGSPSDFTLISPADAGEEPILSFPAATPASPFQEDSRLSGLGSLNAFADVMQDRSKPSSPRSPSIFEERKELFASPSPKPDVQKSAILKERTDVPAFTSPTPDAPRLVILEERTESPALIGHKLDAPKGTIAPEAHAPLTSMPSLPEIGGVEPSSSLPTLQGEPSSASKLPGPLVAENPVRIHRLPPNASHRRPSPKQRSASLSFTSNSPQKHLSAALVQKTWQILQSPPAHLVALMLRIAAKVVHQGAEAFQSFEGHRGRLPGTWESSDEEDNVWASDSDEDDFGIPLNSVPSRSSASSIARDSSSVRSKSRARHQSVGNNSEADSLD